MKRINFERIEIFVDIDKTRCSVENYKKDFANIIYQLGRGIEAHALAFKIFNSNGEIEYNDEECNMIKNTQVYVPQPLLMLSTNYYWNKNNKRKHKRI